MMKTKLYLNTSAAIAGMTLKDAAHGEACNMALHVCDDPAQILNNRQLLADALQINLAQFVCATQTHSANFFRVTEAHIGCGATTQRTAIPDTDALYTFLPNVVLTSFSADCVPVLITNEQAGLIAAVHSGWQGSVKEITRKLLTHLIEHEKCQPEHFRIFIAPAISQARFEVDVDVYKQFAALGYADDLMYFNAETNKYHIDNKQTVKKQCELAGVPAANIVIDPMCTFDSADGFSYRQDKKAGRHLSFIMKKI